MLGRCADETWDVRQLPYEAWVQDVRVEEARLSGSERRVRSVGIRSS